MTMQDTNNQTDLTWKHIGIIILCIRFVQGWIFWGGGSRRFIYDPDKLDPYSAQWMANKLQSAMPGALLGVEHIISYLLQHFVLLYVSIILFSLAELLSGLCLMLGCFTRLAAFITVLISIALMIIFGWEGTTCMDEWTMAVANFAIGLTLVLSGSSIYSIDNWWMKRSANIKSKSWFLVLASGPWSFATLKKAGILSLIFTILFTLTTYNFYRGAIFSRYHGGPVSSYEYHITLDNGKLNTDGTVSFNMYVDAGDTAAPVYIIRIELVDFQGKVIETWERNQLNSLTSDRINNKYAYNRISIGPYGIVAPVSAEATITLKSASKQLHLPSGKYQLQIYTVNGQRWNLTIEP